MKTNIEHWSQMLTQAHYDAFQYSINTLRPGTEWWHHKNPYTIYVIDKVVLREATLDPEVVYWAKSDKPPIHFSRPIKEFLDGRFRPYCPFRDPSYTIAVDTPCPVCGMKGHADAKVLCVDAGSPINILRQ